MSECSRLPAMVNLVSCPAKADRGIMIYGSEGWGSNPFGRATPSSGGHRRGHRVGVYADLDRDGTRDSGEPGLKA